MKTLRELAMHVPCPVCRAAVYEDCKVVRVSKWRRIGDPCPPHERRINTAKRL